jgi:hypothetical protein
VTGLVARCPACQAALSGGPVVFYCGPCGKGVMAADVDVEFHARPDTAVAS